MKRSLICLAALLASATVQAQLIVPKDSKATLTVKYVYTAKGEKKDKYDPRSWDVHRGIDIEVQMVASKPQAMSTLRPMEEQQMASIQKKQAAAQSVAVKQAPMMEDMMKIVAKCGENEACIEKEVQAYGNNMDPNQVNATKAEQAVLAQEDAIRYQPWKAVSQKGAYAVTEVYRGTTADPACMEKPGQRCHREEIRNGGGEIPPAAKKGATTVLFEVDSVKKDVWMTLPAPMVPLTDKREIKSDFPGEASGESRGVVTGSMIAQKPIVVAIPGDLSVLSGTQSIKMEGKEGEGGTVVVTWQWKRQ